MIRVYLQYSYGGFKTFFVEGKEKEAVNMEVTNDTPYGFPQDAHCYFQYGGAKMVYRYLNNGALDLVVREIPSIHKDGDGRSIPCAVQFIGDEEDRQTLDYLAIDIVNDIEKFHDFFSMLFRVREGLRIDGDKLREWIDEHNVPFVCDTNVPQIKNTQIIKSDVILFVPLSSNFGIDDFVTNNVSSELNLPFAQMRRDNCIIKNSDFSLIQKKSKINIDIIDKPPFEDTGGENGNKLKKKDEEENPPGGGGDVTWTGNTQPDIIVVHDTQKNLYDKILKNKQLLYIALGVIVFVIIYIIYSFIKH